MHPATQHGTEIRPMHYTVIITRHGVPHEEWLADTDTPDQAREGCRQQRQHDGEHRASDTYDAQPTPAVSDDDALAHAYASAMSTCPAFRRTIEARHAVPAIAPVLSFPPVAEWLGMDAMPLSIGDAP